MKNKKTLSISEARKNIFEIAEEVQKPGAYYTLTEKGKPKAVILSADGFDNLLDDLDLMSDPGLMDRIRRSEEEIKKGEYVTWEELKKELGLVEQEAIMVRDAPKKGKKKTKR
jgi:antitoxin YefM